jgi:hypothetical protein
MDILQDALHNGMSSRALPIINAVTKECFWIETDISIGGQLVMQVLSRF